MQDIVPDPPRQLCGFCVAVALYQLNIDEARVGEIHREGERRGKDSRPRCQYGLLTRLIDGQDLQIHEGEGYRTYLDLNVVPC